MIKSYGVVSLVLALLVSLPKSLPAAEVDPYETYIKTSKDFRKVKQDRDWALKAWPSWTYMPWYYKWSIGHGDAGGRFSVDHGYNGAFLDNGNAGRLPWIDRYKLRFYMDHTASKGFLYLRKKNVKNARMRFVLINSATTRKVKDIIRRNINRVKGSPNRAAYALDDEVSWGVLVKPCMWRVTDDLADFPRWLKEVYGKENAPDYGGRWIGYNDLRKKLARWRLKDFDCGQLMDQWTYNDAFWANWVGDLVEHANTVDPETPCGFVGGQAPNAFGGYDYARLMRKIQFIEAYNIGGSQAVIRSFNPRNALPQVTTHFHKKVKDTVWQTWYYVAQGNRGFIGWVQGWFNGKEPKPFHKKLAPHYKEVGEKIGPLQAGSEWIHDGVAIYYSHPSIQMSWILDSESHGSTWPNRNGDHRLGTSHMHRKAWENMLRDEGIQFSYISYVDVIQSGVPAEYQVLILPAVYCLSQAEAARIKAFCERGGTVIADVLPGVFDQHGRAHADGAVLDEIFGVKTNMNLKAGDLFRSKLWVEVDQDTNFSWKTYDGFLTKDNDCVKHSSGFNQAIRRGDVDRTNSAGKGTAVLMSLSPQWYNAYRVQGMEEAGKRAVFIKHVRNAGVEPWIRIDGAGESVFGYEITYWKKEGRTIVFVVMNPEVQGSSAGGGNSVGLKSDSVNITLRASRALKGVRDERAGKDLPDGRTFNFDWHMNEAVVLSFTSSR